MNGGATWASTGTGLPSGAINAIATIGEGGLVDNYAFGSDHKVYKQTAGTGNWSAGISLPFEVKTVDVANDVNHTIVATDGNITATSPEPYTTWTTISNGSETQAHWMG